MNIFVAADKQNRRLGAARSVLMQKLRYYFILRSGAEADIPMVVSCPAVVGVRTSCTLRRRRAILPGSVRKRLAVK
jgi:hypothetical protein